MTGSKVENLTCSSVWRDLEQVRNSTDFNAEDNLDHCVIDELWDGLRWPVAGVIDDGLDRTIHIHLQEHYDFRG